MSHFCETLRMVRAGSEHSAARVIVFLRLHLFHMQCQFSLYQKTWYRFSLFLAYYTNIYCFVCVCLFSKYLCSTCSMLGMYIPAVCARSVFQVFPCLYYLFPVGSPLLWWRLSRQHGVLLTLQALTVILSCCSHGVSLASESLGSFGLKMTCPEMVSMCSLQLILSTVSKYGNELYETQTPFSRRKDGCTFLMRLFLNVYVLL